MTPVPQDPDVDDAELAADADQALSPDDGPVRRCVATGVTGLPDGMVRFVRGPDGVVVPDLEERLPGRGAWVTARRSTLREAMARGRFAKAFRAATTVPAGLDDRVEVLLVRRCQELLGLARRAGEAVCGFEKVRARLDAASGRPGLLLAAQDAAIDGRRKLAGIAGASPEVALLDSAELGMAFGRLVVAHAQVAEGGIARRLRRDLLRLSGFRDSTPMARDATTGAAGSGSAEVHA